MGKRRSLEIIKRKLFIIKSINFSQRKEWITDLLLSFKTIRDFLTILERDSVFSTLYPHKVEKTKSSNNRRQIVYNQIHQCLTEKWMNYCHTNLLLLFKTIFVIFWLFWSETSSFPLYAPIKWKRRSLVIIDGKLFTIKSINVSQRKEWITEQTYYSCLKLFSRFCDYFGVRLRLFHFMPP